MEFGSYNPLNLDATFCLLRDVGYVRDTHLCSLLSFSIKKIKFPLANVILGNIFQVKQIFQLDKLYYTFKCDMERVKGANLQSSSHRCRNQGVGWALIDGWSKSAGRGLYSINWGKFSYQLEFISRSRLQAFISTKQSHWHQKPSAINSHLILLQGKGCPWKEINFFWGVCGLQERLELKGAP